MANKVRCHIGGIIIVEMGEPYWMKKMMLIFIYFLLTLFNLKFIEKSFIHFIFLFLFFYSHINTFFQIHQQIIPH